MLNVNLVELLTLACAVLTLACALYAAVTGHRLQRRFDELAGQVTTLQSGHQAHINAPGLHN
ncbi:MAG: hypothetical protein OXG35_31885 [Acidobacteria bacterium]|nr:hypothetical protein [Acidobacteriota bacterium]